MCFGGGPSRAEKESAANQRIEADIKQEQEATKRAQKKREDIQTAIKRRSESKYGRSGRGRRSLMRTGGSGYLGRFE